MNISAINLGKTDQLASINIKSNNTQTDDITKNDKVFENAYVSAGAMTSTTTAPVNGKALMGELNSIKEQLQVSASTAKDSLKALFKKLDGSEVVELDKDGYNLNDMDAEEIVGVVERIQIKLAAYCDDFVPTVSGIDSDAVKTVMGAAANVTMAEYKLNENNLPATEENIAEVEDAFEQLYQSKELTNTAKEYLLANDLDVTIDNIFKAQYAGNVVKQTELSAAEWEALKPQIEGVLNKAGVSADEAHYDTAKNFIEKGIAVTPENIKKAEMLDELNLKEELEDIPKIYDKIVKNMVVGGNAKDTVILDTPVIDKAADIVAAVEHASYREVAAGVALGKSFTIAELKAAYFSNGSDYTALYASATFTSATLSGEQESLANSRYEILLQAKVLMTASSAVSMVKQGLDVADMPLEDVVGRLRAADMATMQYESVNEANEVYSVRMALENISNTSVLSIGAIMAGSQAGQTTLRSISNNAFKLAMSTYNAVGTEVRGDLKDSLFKAVEASSKSLLNDLNLDDSKSNVAAVRILAANNMDVNVENVAQIKDMYAQVNNLIENMTPTKVLNMIRDGLNPMDTDIETLNKYLESQDDGGNYDKFSRFLYKLDKKHDITESERSKFIGIYKMMNIFKKDAGKAVGALMNSKAELTMSNLVAAYNARKAAGKDVRVDDSMGLAQVEGNVRYFDNLFEQTAEKITPDTLKATEDEKTIENRGIEEFCEAIQENYDESVESERLEGYVDDLMSRAVVDERNVEMLLTHSQAVSIDNLMAMQSIMSMSFATSQAARMLKDNRVSFELEPEQIDSAMEEVQARSDEELENATLNTAVDYNNFEDVRMANKEIHLLAQMAKRSDYHLPFEDENGVGIMHLQFAHSDDESKAAISVKTTDGNSVMVEASVSNNILRINALNNYDLEGLQQALSRVAQADEIMGMDFADVRVSAGRAEDLPEINLNLDNERVDSKDLLTIAKVVIRELRK